MYDIKAYFEAGDAEEAVRLLCAHPDACIIAGGSDVLVQIRDGKRKNAELVSIRGIEALRGISRTPDGTLRIGALTSFARLGKDPVILECIPPLAEAACQVGSPQIRNIGTLGGNICNASPTADTPPTLLAWDAQLELFGPEGTHCIPLQDFYLGSKAVAKKPEELLTAVFRRRTGTVSRPSFYGGGHCHRTAPERAASGAFRRSLSAGHSSPGRLAGIQSAPRADRRGTGKEDVSGIRKTCRGCHP